MRQAIIRACLALIVFVMPIWADAASTSNGSNKAVTAAERAQVAAILAQFPNGGSELADAIAKALEADPTLANAVVEAALTATPAQQQAIGGGLALAVAFFAKSDTEKARKAQHEIQAAMAGAPAGTLGAFVLSLLFSTNITTSSCVSPSRPGAGC
jgi:hypothetical protein